MNYWLHEPKNLTSENDEAIKRKWTTQRIIGALLQAETAERRARSIRYRGET